MSSLHSFDRTSLRVPLSLCVFICISAKFFSLLIKHKCYFKCNGNFTFSVLQLYFKMQKNPVMFVFFTFHYGFGVLKKLFHVDFQCTAALGNVSDL